MSRDSRYEHTVQAPGTSVTKTLSELLAVVIPGKVSEQLHDDLEQIRTAERTAERTAADARFR